MDERSQRGYQKLGIATYNLMLSVSEPIRYTGVRDRSVRVADSFYTHVAPSDVDVVCLQELTVDYDAVRKSFIHHLFSSEPMKPSWFGPKLRFWPSGICTLSKYPITHENHLIFTGQTYHVEAYVSKGAIYTRIQHPELGGIHVVNTHLNAWTTPQAQLARLAQVKQVRSWLIGLSLDSSEPLVLCGDLNVDFYENATIIEAMSSILCSTTVLPSTVQFSFDGSTNSMVGIDDPTEYQTVQHDNTDLAESRPLCPRQLVDGFFVSLEHARPVTQRTEVVKVLAPCPFPMHYNINTHKLTRDVSDHYPVMLYLEFELSDSKDLVIYTPKIVVSDGMFEIKWLILHMVMVAGTFIILLALLRRLVPKPYK
jgi:endonuclease/exonuclease/phosphatase family metal-dependent hydrolase